MRDGRSGALIMRGIGVALVCVGALMAGCSKEDPVATKQTDIREESQAFMDEPTKGSQPALLDISHNPAFFTAPAVEPQAGAVKHLDSLIKPILVQVFGDAKLIGEKGTETRLDGEVVLNTLYYAVRRYADQQDGIVLHDAFRAQGFSRSPRLGAKPTITSKFIAMSFTKSTSQGSYSIALYIMLEDQSLRVESYQLGSKYDRMM